LKFSLSQPPLTQLVRLGSSVFDVNQVELASLNVEGARPYDVSVQDVNNDGILDLVLLLHESEIRLP
jgi:hypothetical protein